MSKRECDLCPPVKMWLANRGYTVYVEQFDADVVGVRDDKLVVVELKLNATDVLRDQCLQRAQWADEVWIAVPHPPANLRKVWEDVGIGVVVVREACAVILAVARPQPCPAMRVGQLVPMIVGVGDMWGSPEELARSRKRKRAYRFRELSKCNPAGPDDLGGVACRLAR